MNAGNRPLLFTVLTILMWGMWGFFGKLALQRRMSPITIFLVETLISALIAIPLFLVLSKQHAQPFHVTLNMYGVLSGAVLAIGLLFYYLVLDEAPVSIVVPLTATYPVVTVLLSYGLLGERPSLAQWVGIILVVAGAVLLLSSPSSKSLP